ncbi:MAG TPA: cation:proton antiporter [Candidatus Methanoperedens sp.]
MSTAELITLTDAELIRFFSAIFLLLISAHSFGYLFQKFKMPRAIGEIVGGLVLGPTFLDLFSSKAYEWSFDQSEGKLIAVIYYLGLVLLMFISGFEIEKSFNKTDIKLIKAILIGATAISFIAGWLVPYFFDFSQFLGPNGNMLVLKIIIGIAVAVTSIPVISKIFIDLKIIQTGFAKIILAVATIEDIILWIALAIVTGLVSAGFLSLTQILISVVVTVVFFGISLLVMPKLFNFGNNIRYNLLIKSSPLGYILLICFLFASIASILKVNIIFGAFLAGIIVGMMPQDKFDSVKMHIKEVSLAFFIPIYFAVVGLKLDLTHQFDIMFFSGFLLFAILFKTSGTLLAVRLINKDWLSCFNFAVAMNTRGGPGIVLATIVFDMGIINERFFAVLVMVAIVTSLMAGWWFKYVLSKGWPLMKLDS